MKNGRTQLAAIVLAAIIAFCFGAMGGVAGIYLADKGIIRLPEKVAESIGRITAKEPVEVKTESDEPGEKPVPAQPVINVSSDVTIAEAIAEKVLPSVVGISTVSEYTGSMGLGGLGDFDFWGFGNFGFGGPQQTYESTSIGTGVIVDESGYILTNSHVVGDGEAKSITVSLFDGTDTEGKVLWNDSTLDLAVVKIEGKDLVSAELGDSDLLRIGSYAAAIGNPLGLEFERSMSQGIISGLDRSIAVEGSSGSATTMEGLLQTDATINSGNSGGPLLNSRGEVVGINTAKASSGEGMGFAIPINVAKPIVEQIKNTGKFIRPYIGISGSALEESSYSSDVLIEHFGTDKGIYVHSVSEGGGAFEAGLKEKDVITELNGTPVNTMNKLNSLLVAYKPGDSVTLTVLRDGKELELTVKLTDGVILEQEVK